MDLFKNQLNRLQQQLAGLSASQKMLAAALVVIMFMTLAWSGRYAGQAEMEEIMAVDFAAEDLSRITSLIASKNIPYKASGARVMVPADRKIEVLADLTFAQLLPRDSTGAFEEIINRMSSPIDAPSKTDMIQNHAKEVLVAQMIRFFPKVRSAMVSIDQSVKRSFDGPVTPSATVNIQLKSGEKADRRLVEAAADAVAGSVAAIERKKIRVIIDGASHAVDDTEEGGFGGGSLMDRIRDSESYYSRKVQEQLAYIDGAMIHVTVNVNDEHTSTEAEDYDPKKVAKAEISIRNRTDEGQTITRGSGEPGVVPNTGGSVNPQQPGGDRQSQTGEESETRIDARFSKVTTKKVKGPGSATVTGASVALPRSYFAKIYQKNYQTDKEPQDAVLLPFIDKQLPGIRNQVWHCLNGATEEAVVIDTYTDLLPVAGDMASTTSSGVSMMIGGHVKEIALGALALISLFMVSMMVRKSGPALVTGDAALAEAALAAGAAAKAAGKSAKDDTTEVGEGDASLDGVELDSETIRGQQVLEQVSTLVKENPDAAANLVKRWMNRA